MNKRAPRTRSTLAKLAALAGHPSTPENEWQAAAVKFFQLHRKAGTSPAEKPKADPFKYWHFSAPAPRGPIWTPTEADGNTKYPGLNIGQIAMLDTKYAVELNAEHHRRVAAKRKGKRK